MDDTTVFSLNTQHVKGVMNNGKIGMIAARIVLIKKDHQYGWRKVLDTYIKHAPGIVIDHMTPYSKISPWMLSDGVSLEVARDFLMELIRGHTVITFAGDTKLKAIGLSADLINLESNHIELQDFFKRRDNQPYGLGPLLKYFGITTRKGMPAIAGRDCVEDAQYQLTLYEEHYQKSESFTPFSEIMNKLEYLRLYDRSL